MLLNVIRRAVRVMLYPKQVLKDRLWGNHLLTVYIGVLALIPGIARLLEYSVVRVSEGTRIILTMESIGLSSLYVVMIVIMAWVIAFMIRLFAKLMAHEYSMNSCLGVVAYGLTPVLVSFFFGFIPFLSVFFILYSIIIVSWSISELLRPKKMGFWLFAVSIVFFLFFQLIIEYVMQILTT